MTKFNSVSEMQAHLKRSIYEAIENRLLELCVDTARDHLLEKVYHAYIPQGEFAYDRTYELMDSVTVGNFKMGTKSASFEIFMDSSKIRPDNRNNSGQDFGWNAHADVTYSQDVSEYIPMWVEEGTEGSLWDRDGAHYMEATYYDLSRDLIQALADSLKADGWKVTMIS